MSQEHPDFGTTEEEIFEELKIRHELEPIGSHEEFLTSIDEIIGEKLSFGELHQDEDVVALKERLSRRYDEFQADIASPFAQQQDTWAGQDDDKPLDPLTEDENV